MSTPSQIYERVPQEVLAQYPNLTNEYSFADTVMAKILSEFTSFASDILHNYPISFPLPWVIFHIFEYSFIQR